ncbi:MAG: radical SAM protein [Kiritimatiellaeota bacterium]|nr:radical SAM protein [Kiritimatiellota bacterium]
MKPVQNNFPIKKSNIVFNCYVARFLLFVKIQNEGIAGEAGRSPLFSVVRDRQTRTHNLLSTTNSEDHEAYGGEELNKAKLQSPRRSPHKIFYHVDRLKDWKAGSAFPITLDIDLTNICNNNCPGCHISKYNLMKNEFSNLPKVWGYAQYREGNCIMPLRDARRIIRQFADLGGKSVAFGGGGEQTLHPDFSKIVCFSKECGLDVSGSTNGNSLDDATMRVIVDCFAFINISLDAPDAKLYKLVHGVSERNFNNMLNNIKTLIALRKNTGSGITIGTSYLIGHYTADGAYKATVLAKKLGVDYMRLRPYWTSPGENFLPEEVKRFIQNAERCLKLANDNFEVTYTPERFEIMLDNAKQTRSYKVCNAIHFTVSISADQKVYPCCYLKGNPKYLIGDLKSSSFKEVWYSLSKERVFMSIDFRDCPNPCGKEHELNKVLWKLKAEELNIESGSFSKDPIVHKNFI